MEQQADIGYNVRMNKERRRELDRIRKAKKRASDPEFYARELAINAQRARSKYRHAKSTGCPGQKLGKCCLCPHVARGKVRLDVLHYDHCHKSGKFRGWVCRACNLMIGYSKDCPKTLRRAADYLEKHRA